MTIDSTDFSLGPPPYHKSVFSGVSAHTSPMPENRKSWFPAGAWLSGKTSFFIAKKRCPGMP